MGHDLADAHVKLALWCEAHGLTAERIKHLAAWRRSATPPMRRLAACWDWSCITASGSGPMMSAGKPGNTRATGRS